ncbi:MAG: adenylate/guanylate cyclase domain-containing protein [Rhodobacteraceae bacterium]|nr:adenylate/guanylate cyclase domain-containing protein [Paracoccaceae bacterium]
MTVGEVWGAFRAWAEYRPAGMDDRSARIYAMGRAAFPVALLAHILLALAFFLMDLQALFFFNVGSCLLWSFVVWRVVWCGALKVPFFLGVVIELPLHGALATYYLGIESGFFLYILLTIITSVLAPFLSRPLRYGLSGSFVVMLAAVCGLSVLYGPAIELSAEAKAIFFVLNAICLTGVMALVMGLYEWIADIAETNLIKSRRRTQVANDSLENVSRQLSKYISPQLYNAILNGEQEVKVESRRKKLTVFFSDIVGFTETTDQLQSEELTSLLNEYLTEMSLIAERHGANFDKFIGDAIVLYFGDPETNGTQEDAAACVRMAMEMQHKMATLQSVWRDRGIDRPFQIRIGINTGFCTVGNFGSEDRMDYTIIGGEVNLAARLEGMAEPGGILLANETYQLVKSWVRAEEADTIEVKGFARPVVTYRVTDMTLDDRAEVAALRLEMDPAQMDAAARAAALRTLRAAIETLEGGA